MTPHAIINLRPQRNSFVLTMEFWPQNIKHAIKGLWNNGFRRHNGGHDERWNMKMYVTFVLLLKVKR